MLKYAHVDLSTSADWTRGYRAALGHDDKEIGDLYPDQLKAFMRGYEAGMEASRGQSK